MSCITFLVVYVHMLLNYGNFCLRMKYVKQIPQPHEGSNYQMNLVRKVKSGCVRLKCSPCMCGASEKLTHNGGTIC